MYTKTIALAVGAGLLLAGAAQAQDFQPKTAGTLMLNTRATVVAPDAGDPITTLAGAATGLKAEVSDDVMPTIGLTYFFTDNVAVEVIAGTTKHTIRAKGGATDVKVQETWVLPPVVSLQYHFMPDQKVSPYVGAGLNYMLFYSEKDYNGFGLKVDDGFGYALQAGVDVALQGKLSANLDVKKVFFETDATDRFNGVKSKVNLDPWVVSAGLGYKF
ncbi:outer membrane protein OmpW [Phenylobacterium zucineum HLK1]|uniref:Outer membrane protein OmpW n=1 Tax=Phenylobacterium zucineum (strain HLK1) TaxID=450851 RepID=B4R8A9_PHEZH|nr:OmpW family outer membrane protein [Phenylobacterium zucineum]ACG79227.1 outer membrane protein OmpW [Phenylobacterium zucineum HLK1]